MRGKGFHFKNNSLFVDQLDVAVLASRIPTPFYCYAHHDFHDAIDVLKKNLHSLSPILCFAVKANSNLAVLNIMKERGLGGDIVSGGELLKCLHVGIDPRRMVFSGVGKNAEELRLGLQHQIFQFNVESISELDLLNQLARQHQVSARVALRVNPDTASTTHHKIATGSLEHKFGIPMDEADLILTHASQWPFIQFQGLAIHIGSQLMDMDELEVAFKTLRQFINSLKHKNIIIQYIDLGGGLGVNYQFPFSTPGTPDNHGVNIQHYCTLLQRYFGDFAGRIILEPGRFLCANAGILLTKIIAVKTNPKKTFMIVDAAMNDLIRPTLYDAFHAIIPAHQRPEDSLLPFDVVGPVCETGDYFGLNRMLPASCKAGDLMVIGSAGAYGAVLSSTYNTRPLITEIMVKDDQYHVVRNSSPLQSLWKDETIPTW